jgi:hypothetical protein
MRDAKKRLSARSTVHYSAATFNTKEGGYFVPAKYAGDA